jgi:hypothetical protein
MATARRTKSLFASLALALAAGCGGADSPAIIGDWRSTDPVGSLGSNTLSVRNSLRGEADIKYFSDGDPYHAVFNVVCDATEEPRVSCDFTCQGDCAFLNFTMTCPNASSDRMTCTANGLWETYGFEWSRVP